MTTDTRKLVIRPHRPWLARGLWMGLALLAIIAVVVAFETGRRGAGFDGVAARRERQELNDTIQKLQQTNAELRATIAELQTGQVSVRQEREELARAIGELQGEIARQSQDLAFYRGIVSSTVGGATVRIQQVTVSRDESSGSYLLRVVLVQTTARPEKDVSGTVALSLEGTEADKPRRRSLDSLKFSFRYFETLERKVIFPEGFTPTTVHVQVQVAGSKDEPLTQTIDWNVTEP